MSARLELAEADGSWEPKAALGHEEKLVIGRNDYKAQPAVVSRQHLELWQAAGVTHTDRVVCAKLLGQNKAFLRNVGRGRARPKG